jgi:hypothetical protein
MVTLGTEETLNCKLERPRRKQVRVAESKCGEVLAQALIRQTVATEEQSSSSVARQQEHPPKIVVGVLSLGAELQPQASVALS